jgi:SAM-dependent methyltransferase
MAKPPIPRVRPYRWLAEYFDKVFVGMGSWMSPARRAVVWPLLSQVESACDLACGTGNTLMELAGKGIRVTGVDLSPAMCRLARAKAKKLGLPARIIRGDMRSFRLPEPVDLVLCEYDAVNHVPHRADLARVACAVSQALKPGGYFFFDVNTLLSFKDMWPLTLMIEKPGVVVVMHGGSDLSRMRAWSDVEWFVREGKLWRRHREHVEEVCWTGGEIRAALKGAGFASIRGWDATKLVQVPFIHRGHRTYYLARKSG